MNSSDDSQDKLVSRNGGLSRIIAVHNSGVKHDALKEQGKMFSS